jgi:hypothetical protein
MVIERDAEMKRMLLHVTWIHFVISALVFGLFVVVVLPAQALAFANVTSGSGSPDTSLFYTPSQFYTWALEYGAAGRAHYIRTRFGFDLIWPLVYGAFFYTGIKVGGLRHREWLANVAIITIFFDYMENLFASVAMGLYPMDVSVIVFVAAVSTLLKWSTLSVSGSLMILGWMQSVIKRWKGTKDVVR